VKSVELVRSYDWDEAECVLNVHSPFVDNRFFEGRFAITYQKRDGDLGVPQLTDCTLCPPGKYNIDPGSKGCIECDVGKLSAPNRASCKDCKAGEYNFENLRCKTCEVGK
jgi:hypothetical protein